MSWFVNSAPGKYDKEPEPVDPLLDVQFEILFGDEPGVGQPDRPAYVYAKKWFEGLADPGYGRQEVVNAVNAFITYGFEAPVFFDQRGRTLARFAGNPIDVNPDAAAIVVGTGQTIAAMQVIRIQRGQFVANVHPMVPGKYQKLNAERAPKAAE